MVPCWSPVRSRGFDKITLVPEPPSAQVTIVRFSPSEDHCSDPGATSGKPTPISPSDPLPSEADPALSQPVSTGLALACRLHRITNKNAGDRRHPRASRLALPCLPELSPLPSMPYQSLLGFILGLIGILGHVTEHQIGTTVLK